MSTRGAYGFRVNGQDKVTFKPSDSYPTRLGATILRFVAKTSEAELKQIAERINLTSSLTSPWSSRAILKRKHMPDYQNFLTDSLFCEWAYIINIDEGVVEIYKGFNEKADSAGRYASCKSEPENDYYGVALVRTIPFAEVANITNIQLYCEKLKNA